MNEVSSREIHKDEIDVFAAEVLVSLKEIDVSGVSVLALSGDLGAGKTTFTQALGRKLGIKETITSPTFTIMKSYETTDEAFERLVHMDAYRIDNENELEPLRFSDIVSDAKTLLVVEWAERIKGSIPATAIHLTWSIKDETTRIVQID